MVRIKTIMSFLDWISSAAASLEPYNNIFLMVSVASIVVGVIYFSIIFIIICNGKNMKIKIHLNILIAIACIFLLSAGLFTISNPNPNIGYDPIMESIVNWN